MRVLLSTTNDIAINTHNIYSLLVLLSEFDYELPSNLIAQEPLGRRDQSRMLCVDRATGGYQDQLFSNLPDLLRGDELIVINNARVIPARLFGHRLDLRVPAGTAARAVKLLPGRVEVLLSRNVGENRWEALVRPGRRIRTGERLVFGDGELQAEVVGRGDFGLRLLRFESSADMLSLLDQIGHVPLPPYIRRADTGLDRERYQTVFAQVPSAIAAPTAGLHFTEAVLARLRARDMEIRAITLDVGLGTFLPIRSDTVEAHQMHEETYEISEETAGAINAARKVGRPLLAVGTTVIRALEAAAQRTAAERESGLVKPGRASTSLFLRPGSRFRVVDQLLTNFHLPRSTLLILVAAFAGRESILNAYRHAVKEKYRFYSYGDCMLIR
jgi:S-adenosylmethionine:tRNA ribosyltransferase-isomerase